MNSNDSWSRSMPNYAPSSPEQAEAVQSDSKEMLTIVPVGNEQIEEDDSFSLDKFQVVRREFFSHISEPSITFNNYKIGLNSACIKRLPQIDYIQFLVNRQTRKLAIRPCLESDLHSFQWCTNSGGKRKPRQVTGKIFFMKLFDMMGWNPNYRYKILGKLIRANGEYLFVFDLTSTEVYQRIVKEGSKPKMSRTPVFPAEQVNTPNTISMALDMKRNRIRIHKPTIHMLGDPTLIQLLFDPEDMVVAIVCPDAEVPGGQEVRINPRGLKSRNCFEFCSSMFLRKLRAVHGNLDANCSYRLTGQIIPELRAARFPMSTIQRIECDEGADGNG